MPEVRFEDVVHVVTARPGSTSGRTFQWRQRIDPIFLDVCEEGSIVAVGAVPSHLALVAARVEGNELVVQTDREVDCVTVRLSGVRKGHTWRFRRHTRADMERNQRFWNSWRESS
jgi:hypothetical protein